MSFTGDTDAQVRLRVFDFLREQRNLLGDQPFPRTLLERGFEFDHRRIPLVGPQGIFKPAVCEMPLSITTAPVVEGRERTYDDEIGEEGLLKYRYRGTDPNHHDNVGLRRTIEHQTPLVYFHGVVPGLYEPAWPVYIVGDDPAALTFAVAVDDRVVPIASGLVADPALVAARRTYVTAVIQRRLHQQGFRQRVLRAYRDCCAICRLRHQELLDAAHILPDGHPRGEPIVPNGLALCRLHHAAFDRHLLGVRPDLTVELRLDVLREENGPMLRHGLQGFQGTRIHVPRNERLRPNLEFLAERYDLFRRAS